MALAGGLDLRHGDLPHSVRPLSESSVPLVCPRTSRADGGSRRGGCLRSAEHRWRPRSLDDFAVAILCFVGAIRADGVFVALQVWRAGECGDQANNFNGRYSWWPAHLYVELHGMGQCLDHRH